MRFKSTANVMAVRFYHWAPPVRTVCFQSWGARLGKSLHSYLLLCKIEFLRKPQRQIQILRSLQPITVLSRPPCSSHEVAWGSPPGRSHTSHESWGIRRTHSDAVCCHMPYDERVFGYKHFDLPPLIPGLFSVQDKEKVFKLWKTELLPLYLTGVVFLKIKFWLLPKGTKHRLPEEQISCPLLLPFSPKALLVPMASLLPAAAVVSNGTRTCFLEN